VEVIQEFQTWRRIRDSDGTTGWVYQGMLSGRRTVVVLPWDAKAAEKPKAELYTRESASSPLAALVEAGAVGSVRACDGTWCELTFGNHIGYMMQKKLWGVYPGEYVR
jgi:SH3-like domain-containing protein